MAAAANTFDSIWTTKDPSLGLTSTVSNYTVKTSDRDIVARHWLSQQFDENFPELLLYTPILQAPEYDFASVLNMLPDGSTLHPLVPPETASIDAAIDIFVQLFPRETDKIQQGVLEQLASYIASPHLDKDPLALVRAFKQKLKSSKTSKSTRTFEFALDLLHVGLMHSDAILRFVSAEALGALCSMGDSALVSSEIQHLTQQIVDNQSPEARAGCALALGYIHQSAGSMTAGLHLQKIFGVLFSLCRDPHPIVHFWAFEGLSLTVESAGISFNSYLMSTLALISSVYTSNTHDPETAEIAMSNIGYTMPLVRSLVRCLNITVGVLGPDLLENSKARKIIQTLIFQLEQVEDPGIRVEIVKTKELVSLFVPGAINIAEYISFLKEGVDNGSARVQFASLKALQQLVNRCAHDVFGPSPSNWHLWDILDKTTHKIQVQEIFNSWIHQTAHLEPVAWIRQCQTVLSNSNTDEAKSLKELADPTLDEETATFAIDTDPGKTTAYTWQTQVFALECIHSVLQLVSQQRPDLMQLDPGNEPQNLVTRVGELVRIAFNSSTAVVPGLRLAGVVLLQDIIRNFKNVQDPDFEDLALLEQYQAQIGSALTPAFSADSTADVAARAIDVCADFIASGVVKDVCKMGRILKFLVSALENCKAETLVIGEMRNLGETAETMLRLAVVSAWAELQIASCTQRHLLDVVRPHLSDLSLLWLQSLADYANLRFGPHSPESSSQPNISLGNEALLHVYDKSWHVLVDAIASLVDRAPDIAARAFGTWGSKYIQTENTSPRPGKIFYILFGLCHETLLTATNRVASSDDSVLRILHVYEKVLRPSICGFEIYQDEIFSETMDLLYRLVSTQRLDFQKVVLKIARNLVVEHPSSHPIRSRRKSEVDVDPRLDFSQDVDQIFELARLTNIVVCANFDITERTSHGEFSPRRLAYNAVIEAPTASLKSMGYQGLDSLVEIIEVFPSVIKVDLYNTVLYVFACLLERSDMDAPILSSLTVVCRHIVTTSIVDPATRQPLELLTRTFLAQIIPYFQRYRYNPTSASIHAAHNALMVSVIVLTTIGDKLLPSSDSSIADFIDAISQGYTSSEVFWKVSLQCTRTILRSASSNPIASEIFNRLLPYLLATVSLYPLSHPTEGFIELVGLIFEDLNISFEKVPFAFAVILPALTACASKPRTSTKDKSTVSAILVTLATSNPNAFKITLSSLEPFQQSQMEELVRTKSGRKRSSAGIMENATPTISLKTNFDFE
ncbi:Pof6 interactor protein 1 [Neolecta irregularis DAH-3]|uniref:Pof6 interactor protein 1 n=1 Tax=Neolecta irregularis (strain DAH-3) TaxID=1198029 RepID=A0A1U7LUJ8_NEOID|nr:Pof6 interactor protein 1 [Neolecta irregularis DAH-3]|eukprot:OLL26288.1 Pof6 interactor protein 1 [Neolecta irregularis DAH-3]